MLTTDVGIAAKEHCLVVSTIQLIMVPQRTTLVKDG